MTDEPSVYVQAHLVAAAVRLFAHQENRQPTAEDVARFLGLSLEMILHIMHRMREHGIVDIVPSAFKEVIYLRDHTRIEELAEEGEGPSVAEKFQEAEEARYEKVSEISSRFSPAYEDERKKDLFADLQEKLKTGGKSGKPNPLDELKKK